MKPITGTRAPVLRRERAPAQTPGAAATETDPQICTVCGYIIAPATGHIHHTTTLVPAVEATCVDMGHRAYYTCSGCSKHVLQMKTRQKS